MILLSRETFWSVMVWNNISQALNLCKLIIASSESKGVPTRPPPPSDPLPLIFNHLRLMIYNIRKMFSEVYL